MPCILKNHLSCNCTLFTFYWHVLCGQNLLILTFMCPGSLSGGEEEPEQDGEGGGRGGGGEED